MWRMARATMTTHRSKSPDPIRGCQGKFVVPAHRALDWAAGVLPQRRQTDPFRLRSAGECIVAHRRTTLAVGRRAILAASNASATGRKRMGCHRCRHRWRIRRRVAADIEPSSRRRGSEPARSRPSMRSRRSATGKPAEVPTNGSCCSRRHPDGPRPSTCPGRTAAW